MLLCWIPTHGELGAVLSTVAGGMALLSSPRGFLIARVGTDGTCENHAGRVGLADVFEARAFTAERELRWVRRGATGDAVLLGEDLQADDIPATAKRCEQTGLCPADIDYLLWGEPVPDAEQRDGWMKLSSARIGTLHIPGSWPAGNPTRLRLRAREYLAVDDAAKEYGNAYVFEERLIGIAAMTGEETHDG